MENLLTEIRDLLVEIRDDARNRNAARAATDGKVEAMMDAVGAQMSDMLAGAGPIGMPEAEDEGRRQTHNCGDNTEVESLGDNLHRVTMQCGCGERAVGIVEINNVLPDGTNAMALGDDEGGIIFRTHGSPTIVVPDGDDSVLVEGSGVWYALMCGTMLDDEEIRDRVAEIVRERYDTQVPS